MELMDYCQYYMIPIIITAVWLCISAVLFFRKKSRGLALAIFILGGLAIPSFVWPHWIIKIDDYKAEVLARASQKEWQSLDPQLRMRLNGLVKRMGQHYFPDTVINPDKVLDGKFIAVIHNNNNSSDTIMVSTLEYRINEALKEHNQYSAVADELDYAIVFQGKTEYDRYGTRGESSVTTEQAQLFVIDLKTDSIVKAASLMPLNPGSIEEKKFHHEDYKYMLSKKALYLGATGAYYDAKEAMYEE